MPAVFADPSTLPHLGLATGRARTVKSVTFGPQAYEGEGFPVTRAFAGVSYADLDPFIHMDEMGEVEYARSSRGAPLGTHTAVSKPSPT